MWGSTCFAAATRSARRRLRTTMLNPLAPLIMFAAGPGTITAIVTLAAVHTPEGLPVTAIVAAVVGAAVTYSVFASRNWGRITSQRRHAGDCHPLHGAHCGVHGNAVRADGIEGVLEPIGPGRIPLNIAALH